MLIAVKQNSGAEGVAVTQNMSSLFSLINNFYTCLILLSALEAELTVKFFV